MTFRLLLLTALTFCAGWSQEPADLLLIGGVVHTLDDDNPLAEAVAIEADRIVCVGSTEECRAYRGSESLELNLAGRTVVPGFSDSHMHLSGVGFRELRLNLAGAKSLEEMLAQVRERAERTSPGEWIVGRGWIEAQWDPPVFPTAADLDRATTDHPIYLVRADGHGAVVNSAALRLAGVDADTVSPSGGEIMQDPQTGEPTGMLLDRAQGLVRSLLPEETREGRREALRAGARRSVERGWTQVSIAGGGLDQIALIRELYRAGQMPLRIYSAVSGPGPAADHLLENGPETDPALFSLRSIKLYMDGALGSKGAALLEPYEDHPTTGLLMHEPEALLPLLERALRAGVQIQTHAIGDRANRVTLDLYERAFAAVPVEQRRVAEPRWRIEHAQILDPADIPRFGELGVIASMQPSHAITDMHFAKSRLGEDRLAGAYAWRSLLDAGARLAAGSDAPVEEGDPLIEFYAAAVRKDLDGFSEPHWGRGERLTRKEALQALTLGGAYAAFEEEIRGSIEVGKQADLTILSHDILAVPEDQILDARCEMTIVAGNIVYER